MKISIALLAMLLLLIPAFADSLVADGYSAKKHPIRKALRGDWTLADGTATVEQDDGLYKKYKNHGPIMVYEVPHQDAVAVVEFKPTDCKAVVFTMDADGGGHAFRVKMRSAAKRGPGSEVVTYAAKKKGAEKAETIVLAKEGVPLLKNGDWNRIEVRVLGKQATVTINGKALTVKHARIAQAKKIAKLGFSFGKLSIRSFTLEGI